MLNIFFQFVACIYMLWRLLIKRISVFTELPNLFFLKLVFCISFEKIFPHFKVRMRFPYIFSNTLKLGFSNLILKSKRFGYMD